jgi:hypothetical protein
MSPARSRSSGRAHCARIGLSGLARQPRGLAQSNAIRVPGLEPEQIVRRCLPLTGGAEDLWMGVGCGCTMGVTRNVVPEKWPFARNNPDWSSDDL